MFAFLTRRKEAGIAAGLEADAAALSIDARRKRLFDRTLMTPDTIVPAAIPSPMHGSFGLKRPAE